MMLSLSDLKEKFNKPLPGLPSQLKMAPQTRALELQNAEEMIPNATLSAVMILLFHDENELKTVLIKRSEYEGIHSGQMAFPGGKKEPIDPDFEATALREAHEEIGISPHEIEIIGKLSDLFLPPSNFLMKVVVGYCHSKPIFWPNAAEVQAIVDVNISDLSKIENQQTMQFYAKSLGQNISAPCYKIFNHQVWGATAMIISELLDVLNLK